MFRSLFPILPALAFTVSSIFVVSEGLYAQEHADAAVVEVKSTTSRDNRRDSHLSVLYVPLNVGLILPTKRGFALSWVVDESVTIEGEYLSGSYGLGFLSLDLVSLSERLMTVRARWYPWNTLNVFAGIGQRKYRFGLGSEVQEKLVDYKMGNVRPLEVENQVANFGFGNRWQFDNGITLGIDWFEWIVGIGRGKVDEQITPYIKDQKLKDSTQNVLDYMRFGSTVNVLKVQLGYTF